MDMAKLAAEHGLDRVGGRPSLPQYIKRLWKRGDFTLTLSRYRIQSENERNRLGMLWVVLRPTFSAIIYGVIFGVILGGAGMRPDDFVPFVVIGVFMLEFFNSSMNGGAKSIISNASLVQSLPFPRIVLPIATVMQNLLNFMPTMALMIIVAVMWGRGLRGSGCSSSRSSSSSGSSVRVLRSSSRVSPSISGTSVR